MSITDEAKVYVGTYGKYNSGSIEGAWFELSDYDNKEAFYGACQELHGPGEHEFMFQDWEGIPEGMIGESFISDDAFKWAQMEDYDRELVMAFIECFGISTDTPLSEALDNANSAFAGRAATYDDWVYEFVDEIGLLGEMSDTLKTYFDYEKYGRDLSFDVSTAEADDGDVIVFWSNW